MDTLVLSTGFQPVKYVKFEKAFCLWFSGRAEVIEFHENRFIHTVSETFRIPSIIRYVRGKFAHEHTKKKASFSREGVRIRDEYTCQYCGKVMTKKECTLDHILPESRGGLSSWKNLVACCNKCNQYKNDMTPKEAGMRLLRETYIPDQLELHAKDKAGKGVPSEWKTYL